MNPFGPSPVVVGHRGGRGDGWPPENTLSAFERARDEGALCVETDVRLCADEAVLLHDPTLSRVSGGRDTRTVAEVAYRTLPLVAGNGRAERVARLSDLLTWAHRTRMALDVEIKHDVPDRLALVRAVARLIRGAQVPVVFSSFDPLSLAALRVLAPRVPSALLTDPEQKYARSLHAIVRPPLFSGLIVERRQVNERRVERWRRRGLMLGVWTVNDAEEARGLARVGVDLLITDRPGDLVRALRA